MSETLPLEPSLIVAELGCGPAFTAEALAPRVRRLVGFEIARGTVEALDGCGLPSNLDVVPADLCDPASLAGFSRAFDLVFSTDTLEHVDDPSAFFATVAQLLKPGRRAVVLFPNEPPARRHGETSFATGAELLAALGPDLTLAAGAEVTQRPWARFLHRWGWKRPLALVKRAAGLEPAVDRPQTFDETVAGRHGFRPRRLFALLNAYGRVLVKLSGERGGFRLAPLAVDDDTPLLDRYLWLELERHD